MNNSVNIKEYYTTLKFTEQATIFVNNKLSKMKDTQKKEIKEENKKSDKITFIKQNNYLHHTFTLSEILKSCLEQGPSPYPHQQQEYSREQLPNHLQLKDDVHHLPPECKDVRHHCNSDAESYS
jgi:ABC-type lipoprotein export system ATPase subunit